MYDLASFGLQEMIESGRQLRDAAAGSSSMQDAASCVVDMLYESFRVEATGEPCFALVRCFKTHPLSDLPVELANIAKSMLADPDPSPAMRCLALLATRGERPEWNTRRGSLGHQAIPLPTAELVARAPMIARLIVQLGLRIEDVVDPGPGLLLDLERQPFNVFHVEDALGSEFVPAQKDFVEAYGVKSVLGFGGVLPTGDLFAVVMFSKVRITRDTAAMFRTLALSVKLALLPVSGARVFND